MASLSSVSPFIVLPPSNTLRQQCRSLVTASTPCIRNRLPRLSSLLGPPYFAEPSRRSFRRVGTSDEFVKRVSSRAYNAVPIVRSTMEVHKEIHEWLQKARHANEKLTKLHFYFHDTLTGSRPTAIRVASHSTTDTSSTRFGLINVIDDPLTEGPDLNSKLVGQVRGLYAASGLEEFSVTMAMNFVFTSGEYKGSSLAILGQNLLSLPIREMPIVGGTGIFRLARGIVVASTHFANPTTYDAIVELHVYALHY